MQRSRRRGGLNWHRFGRGFLLALLMLLAQQGALLHELGHYRQDDGAVRQDPDKRHPGQGLCKLCVAFSLTGAATVPAPFAAVLLAGLAFALFAAAAFAPAAAEPPALRNRGPPAAL